VSIQIIIATYRPVSINRKDILESYSAVTVDGFDFIITGRALASGIYTEWPVLRNPLFTLISAIDSVLGNIGIAFGLVIGISLTLQFLSLNKMFNYFRFSESVSASLLVIFFMNNIHFIDIYVLSDSISLSLMLYGITLIVLNENQKKELNGSLIIVASSLGQFYTLFGLLFLLTPVKMNLKSVINKIRQRNTIITFFFLIISLVVRKFWTSEIGHNSSPDQFGLLKLNLNMFNFYFNAWAVIFVPFIIVLIYLVLMEFSTLKKFISVNFIKSGFYISLVVSVFLFFYQWKESRFSYLLFILIVVNVILVIGKNQKMPRLRDALPLIALLTIVFNTLWTPSDNWQPRIGESSFLRPWVTERYWERVPFTYYVEIRNKSCLKSIGSIDNSKAKESLEEDLLSLPDPVRVTARFGIENCL
jgi:hypothetical protein